MTRQCMVYVLANDSRMLYVGVTSRPETRMAEHRTRAITGYTARHRIHRLVYFESTPNIRGAITREKQIKGMRRAAKLELIENMNPEWRDLAEEWFTLGVSTPSLRSG